MGVQLVVVGFEGEGRPPPTSRARNSFVQRGRSKARCVLPPMPVSSPSKPCAAQRADRPIPPPATCLRPQRLPLCCLAGHAGGDAGRKVGRGVVEDDVDHAVDDDHFVRAHRKLGRRRVDRTRAQVET